MSHSADATIRRFPGDGQIGSWRGTIQAGRIDWFRSASVNKRVGAKNTEDVVLARNAVCGVNFIGRV